VERTQTKKRDKKKSGTRKRLATGRTPDHDAGEKDEGVLGCEVCWNKGEGTLAAKRTVRETDLRNAGPRNRSVCFG